MFLCFDIITPYLTSTYKNRKCDASKTDSGLATHATTSAAALLRHFLKIPLSHTLPSRVPVKYFTLKGYIHSMVKLPTNIMG
jgi:hypothetical protein